MSDLPVPPDDTLQPVRTGVQGGLGQTGQEDRRDGNMSSVNSLELALLLRG